MATGANDAQGIWQYGEDDSNATFSALMNRLGSSTSTQFGVDRGRLTTLEARSLSAFSPVVPSSVDKSGGTSTVATNGTVTFATVAYVSLNGVFTNTYDYYKIFFSYSGSATAANTIRLRSTGTDNTTANYVVGRTYQDDNVGGFQNTGVQTAWGTVPSASVAQYNAEITLVNPKQAAPTQGWHIAGASTSSSSGSKMVNQSGSMLFQASTSFDGISIIASTGTISGTVQVVGFNK